jgi:transposase
MVVYLHYAHAIGLERLRALMSEVFGLSISEGALCNILARARPPLGEAAAAITAEVRQARVVCSDETSVRVAGKTWWEWVFATPAAVLHLIRPSRGRVVPETVFAGVRPEIWVSDAFGSQRGHADRWQICLAHLLRDAQWAVDCGDAGFSAQFKLWLLRALAIGRRREGLRDSTLARYRADLERRLDRIMAHATPQAREGDKLRRRIGRCREHLVVFTTEREVPPTNNVSERALRPSVVFRKVTNGFRSEWGAETYAAFRSVVSTAKAKGETVLNALRSAIGQQRECTVG